MESFIIFFILKFFIVALCLIQVIQWSINIIYFYSDSNYTKKQFYTYLIPGYFIYLLLFYDPGERKPRPSWSGMNRTVSSIKISTYT